MSMATKLSIVVIYNEKLQSYMMLQLVWGDTTN